MADQTVKIETDSAPRERVALDLVKFLNSTAKDFPEPTIENIVNLYVTCRRATLGHPYGK